MSYKSFELLKKLYFVRTGGSKEELEAANIIKKECESLGAELYALTTRIPVRFSLVTLLILSVSFCIDLNFGNTIIVSATTKTTIMTTPTIVIVVS